MPNPTELKAVKSMLSRTTSWSAYSWPCDMAPRAARSGEPFSQCVRYAVPKA